MNFSSASITAHYNSHQKQQSSNNAATQAVRAALRWLQTEAPASTDNLAAADHQFSPIFHRFVLKVTSGITFCGVVENDHQREPHSPATLLACDHMLIFGHNSDSEARLYYPDATLHMRNHKNNTTKVGHRFVSATRGCRGFSNACAHSPLPSICCTSCRILIRAEATLRWSLLEEGCVQA